MLIMKNWESGKNRLRGSKANFAKFADHIISSIEKNSTNKISHKSSILDVGCGDGQMLNYIINFYNLESANGCDISDFYIDPKKFKKIKFKKISNSKFQYEDESFDIVYSFGVLQYVKTKDLANFLKESYRVLKKGGVCFHCNMLDKNKIFKYHHNPKLVFKELISFTFFGGLRAYITNKQWNDGSYWHNFKNMTKSFNQANKIYLKDGFSSERSDIFFKK